MRCRSASAFLCCDQQSRRGPQTDGLRRRADPARSMPGMKRAGRLPSQRKRCNSQAAKVICVGRVGKPCAGADRSAPKPAPFPDSPAGLLELWRGHRGSDKSKVLQQRPFPERPIIGIVDSSHAKLGSAHWLGSAHVRRGLCAEPPNTTPTRCACASLHQEQIQIITNANGKPIPTAPPIIIANARSKPAACHDMSRLLR